MKLFNTLSRKIEDFVPLNPPKVNLFVCGPTVYDFAHIGNAKTYTQFDFVVKYLRARGFDVFYVMNITDIDDKIIQRSKEQGVAWNELAGNFERVFLEDMKAMHNTAVTKYARATGFIDEIVRQIQKLVKKGYGYETSDGIYFDIAKFKDYGKLSGRTEADQDAGVSRIDEGLDKKNKNDFCLWKKSKPGEPFWKTDLGTGRPGWHIEDTAITETLLGEQYDVHGGAIDLIFPHHEAEVSQMESASGKSPLVRYWIHVAFLNMNANKMSKSRGNFISMRVALEKYGYRLLRFFFISNHYRTSLEWSDRSLEQAKGALKRIDEFTLSIDQTLRDDESLANDFNKKIFEYLDNDFDTPNALAEIFNFIHEQNVQGKPGKNTFKLFQELNKFLDFMTFELETPEEIQKLLNEREELRQQKKFAEADELRKKIIQMGYEVKDPK
ncbi:cysteine--tRNA ligase [Candidatus Gottesmanbacteria bacterium RIFCSPHIGHO2_01_FULL_42_12]|uniref:Cysteine--tRNA ligase n=1 Tax=Candidatus Gottesmanbacteria bacterium RIFCSPHIGHO2_01_FULL_42_12 TaxID=1798377 RepID=A0A1F5Z6A2_9BACT|nr:MAG: cysteine--tRNA ligase [Candidatus Gottesmanbacteria bacterium RIFCSPHIGHO2_01_FULL_42_12]